MKNFAPLLLATFLFAACGDDATTTDLVIEGVSLSKARFSKDSANIVVNYQDDDGEHVATMQRDGKDVKIIASDANYLTAPTWNADGASVIYYGTAIQKVDLDGTNNTVLVDAFAAMDPDISSDGSTLIWGVNGGSLFLRTLPDGPTTPLTEMGASPRFSPDGTQIAFATAAAIRVMKADGSDVQTLVSGDLSYLSTVAWLPNGKQLAITSTRGVELVDLEDGARKTLVDQFAAKDVDVSPDGNWIVYGVNGQTGLSIITDF